MTLKSLIDAQASRVFLNTNHFARSVTRWPAGVRVDAETVTAVFEEDPPSDERAHGHDNLRRGTLFLDADQTAVERDLWKIDGVVWRVTSLGRVEGGMRSVELEHTTPVRRRALT